MHVRAHRSLRAGCLAALLALMAALGVGILAGAATGDTAHTGAPSGRSASTTGTCVIPPGVTGTDGSVTETTPPPRCAYHQIAPGVYRNSPTNPDQQEYALYPSRDRGIGTGSASPEGQLFGGGLTRAGGPTGTSNAGRTADRARRPHPRSQPRSRSRPNGSAGRPGRVLIVAPASGGGPPWWLLLLIVPPVFALGLGLGLRRRTVMPRT